MDGKVLVFVRDYQLKRKVLSAISSASLPFVEVFEPEELSFKMQLIQDNQRLYIHEYMHDNPKQYDMLKDMKDKGWKTLVIYPKYEIEYIDKSQEVGVNDLMILPIEEPAIKNKIITLLNIPIREEVELISDEKVVEGLKSVVELEISRAIRGNHKLSFVLLDLGILSEKEQVYFIKHLSRTLRETDRIVDTLKKDYYLVICPFTPKNFLVEVENKIRTLFKSAKDKDQIKPIAKLYLYGLTFGTDGDDFESLYGKLIDNINNSKILDQVFLQRSSKLNPKLRTYERISYQNRIKKYLT